MNYEINAMSFYGEGILNETVRGTVHSVYRKTVNLFLGAGLLALQPLHSPISPISLPVNISEQEFERLGIEAGDSVLVTGEAVEIRGGTSFCAPVRFLRRGAERKDLKLSRAMDSDRIGEIAGELERKLAGGRPFGRLGDQLCGLEKSGAGNPFGNSFAPDLIAEAAENFVGEAGARIRSGDWNGAADRLCRLIGLGIGLTPGGDDFLCGVLAGLILGDLKRHPFTAALKREIADGLERTNDISRAFLNCALRDQFGPSVHAFYEETAETVLDGMRQIGHTSGIDTLRGILYGFRLREELKPGDGAGK